MLDCTSKANFADDKQTALEKRAHEQSCHDQDQRVERLQPTIELKRSCQFCSAVRQVSLILRVADWCARSLLACLFEPLGCLSNLLIEHVRERLALQDHAHEWIQSADVGAPEPAHQHGAKHGDPQAPTVAERHAHNSSQA